jgi:hypothetical protein
VRATWKKSYGPAPHDALIEAIQLTKYTIDLGNGFTVTHGPSIAKVPIKKMKAYDLYKEFLELPPERQRYVLGYFTGSLDGVASGFTTPHPDQAHAQWAIAELENAMTKKGSEPGVSVR